MAPELTRFAKKLRKNPTKAEPLTPVFTYADTHAKNEVVWPQTEFDETEVHDRTGCHFHASYLPAVILCRSAPYARFTLPDIPNLLFVGGLGVIG